MFNETILHDKFTFETVDKEQANHYMKALDYHRALFEFRQQLRMKLKHGDYSDEQQQAVEEVWQIFHDTLQNNEIDNV